LLTSPIVVGPAVSDPKKLVASMRGCDWCFHVAASYRLWLRDYAPMYAVNVEGTRNVIEAAVDAVLQKFLTEGPTPEEMQKATAGTELGFLRGLESNNGKANQLLDGAVFHGDPGYFKTDYQKTLAVTAADVKRVANQYLTKGRLVLSVVPKGKKDQAAKESQSVSEQHRNTRGGRS